MRWMQSGSCALLVTTLVVLTACSGGDPSSVSFEKRLVLRVVLENTDGAATLDEVSLFLDGNELMAQAPAFPAPRVEAEADLVVPAGRRTLSASVSKQTSDPSDYRLSAAGTWGGDARNFGSVVGSVSTGGSIAFIFELEH